MEPPTLDEIYPDNVGRPHADNPEKRLAYLEQVLKHIMALGNNGCDYERLKDSAEEALGWRAPFETEFALSNVPSDLSLLAFGTVPAREADQQELCRKSRRDRD